MRYRRAILHFLHEKVFGHQRGTTPNKFTNFVYAVMCPIHYIVDNNTTLRYDITRDIYVINKMEISGPLIRRLNDERVNPGSYGITISQERYKELCKAADRSLEYVPSPSNVLKAIKLEQFKKFADENDILWFYNKPEWRGCHFNTAIFDEFNHYLELMYGREKDTKGFDGLKKYIKFQDDELIEVNINMTTDNEGHIVKSNTPVMDVVNDVNTAREQLKKFPKSALHKYYAYQKKKMKKHVRIYLDHYNYGEEDVIVCECGCGKVANQIHHLIKRGMGGSKIRDNIENLIALTMKCHEKADTDTKFNNKLKSIKKREFNGKSN